MRLKENSVQEGVRYWNQKIMTDSQKQVEKLAKIRKLQKG